MRYPKGTDASSVAPIHSALPKDVLCGERDEKVLVELFQKLVGFQGKALNRSPQRAKSCSSR